MSEGTEILPPKRSGEDWDDENPAEQPDAPIISYQDLGAHAVDDLSPSLQEIIDCTQIDDEFVKWINETTNNPIVEPIKQAEVTLVNKTIEEGGSASYNGQRHTSKSEMKTTKERTLYKEENLPI